MTERLEKIFSVIPKCRIFADIACDHGYIAKAMIDSGKCERAIASDISGKCLKKAEILLKEYIERGRAECCVSDGFDNVKNCDLALISGLGGEEIIKILSRTKSLPDKLVLQPMKHVEKVREFVVTLGYKIVYDEIFKDGIMFYNLILLEKGKDFLTEEEIFLGRTNITNPKKDFLEMVLIESEKISKYVDDVEDVKKRSKLKNKLEFMKKYVKN